MSITETPVVGRDAQELPELTFEIASATDTFPAYSMTYGPGEIAMYSEATGDHRAEYAEIVPPGMAAIFGRDAYLRQHRMPGGGVLLGQDIQWFGPAKVGMEMTIQARVVRAHEDERGRRSVLFVTTASQQGRVVAQVRINAGWPS